MFDLKNKVALVTGARRGMGKAHAIALAKQGARVAVTDIDLNECALVVEEITKSGGEAIALALDVSKKSDVDRAFDEVVRAFGRLDILINNAGIFIPKATLEMTEEEWDTVIGVNLKGQFFCAQRAAKEMAKNKWGRIINIASIVSGGVGVGMAGATHYAASKGGVIGMTECMAVEFASLGITANVVAPGAIDTPMARTPGEELPKEVQELIARQTPMKRIGTPEEVSAAVIFLASDEASYVTGTTLYVDGGWLAS